MPRHSADSRSELSLFLVAAEKRFAFAPYEKITHNLAWESAEALPSAEHSANSHSELRLFWQQQEIDLFSLCTRKLLTISRGNVCLPSAVLTLIQNYGCFGSSGNSLVFTPYEKVAHNLARESAEAHPFAEAQC